MTEQMNERIERRDPDTPPEADTAADRAPRHTPVPVRLGFARGIAPAKWERRWRAMASGRSLELVPLDLAYGETAELHTAAKTPAAASAELTASCDMIIMRTAPGTTPAGSEGSAAPRHALRLYTEAIALVVSADHDLAAEESVTLDDLALVTLLDHPDHFAGWPAAEPWADAAWTPAGPRAALDLVATGAGAILLPLPLARHLTQKRQHAVLPFRPTQPQADLPGAERPDETLQGSIIWAVWDRDRDDADLQQLAGVLRGRTARSSRTADEEAPKAPRRERTPQPTKKAPKLKPGSRGAQLAAAKAKAERKQAEARAAKKRKRR